MEQVKIMSFPEPKDGYIEVPVNNGTLKAKVSHQDYHKVHGLDWVTTRTGEVMLKSSRIYLRRYIGGTKAGFVNGDKLDARRENLKINF